jgi:hypothetical protein
MIVAFLCLKRTMRERHSYRLCTPSLGQPSDSAT